MDRIAVHNGFYHFKGTPKEYLDGVAGIPTPSLKNGFFQFKCGPFGLWVPKGGKVG